MNRLLGAKLQVRVMREDRITQPDGASYLEAIGLPEEVDFGFGVTGSLAIDFSTLRHCVFPVEDWHDRAGEHGVVGTKGSPENWLIEISVVDAVEVVGASMIVFRVPIKPSERADQRNQSDGE